MHKYLQAFGHRRMLLAMKLNDLQTSSWLDAQAAQLQIPAEAWTLISHPGSLTEHLRQLTNNKITLRLLLANWDDADPTERQALNVSADERTWVRCIEHRYQDKVWVYGRAVFPKNTITTTQTTIKGLGVQSLGDIIFKDPNLKRDPFSYCLINDAWARRSILYFQEQPLLITEIFMPECYAPSNR